MLGLLALWKHFFFFCGNVLSSRDFFVTILKRVNDYYKAQNLTLTISAIYHISNWNPIKWLLPPLASWFKFKINRLFYYDKLKLACVGVLWDNIWL